MKNLKIIEYLLVMMVFTKNVIGDDVDHKRVNGRPGERINVPCNAPDHNATEIKWFKDDQLKVQWEEDRDIFYPSKEDKNKYTIDIQGELIIQKANISDSGNYTCQYLNTIDTVSTEEWKEVKVWAHCDPPHRHDSVTHTPKLDAYGEGTFVNISCNKGYTLSGNATIECLPSDNGSSWSTENQTCIESKPRSDTNWTAILLPIAIFAVISIIIVAVICLVKRRRNKREKKTDKGKELDDLSGKTKKHPENTPLIGITENKENVQEFTVKGKEPNNPSGKMKKHHENATSIGKTANRENTGINRNVPDSTDKGEELDEHSEKASLIGRTGDIENVQESTGDLDNKCFLHIGHEIGQKFRNLGIHLGLTNSEVFNIQDSSQSAGDLGFQILNTWNQRTEGCNKRQVLANALRSRDIGRADLAKYVEEYKPTKKMSSKN